MKAAKRGIVPPIEQPVNLGAIRLQQLRQLDLRDSLHLNSLCELPTYDFPNCLRLHFLEDALLLEEIIMLDPKCSLLMVPTPSGA